MKQKTTFERFGIFLLVLGFIAIGVAWLISNQVGEITGRMTNAPSLNAFTIEETLIRVDHAITEANERTATLRMWRNGLFFSGIAALAIGVAAKVAGSG